MDAALGWNARYAEHEYRRFKRDPQSVTAQWRAFFQGFELGRDTATPAGGAACELQAQVDAMLYRYRDLGHLLACLDPLSVCPVSHPLLDLEAFGLEDTDPATEVWAPDFFPAGRGPLGKLQRQLRETYCRAVGVEFMHLQDPQERDWLRERMEGSRNRTALDPAERAAALELMIQAGHFEEFLQRRYLGQTRFSLEGAEALLPLLREVVDRAAAAGAAEVVLAMAHRGRLNVRVNLMGKPLEDLFCEFEASYDPAAVPGGGDVKYHSGYVGELGLTGERRVRIILPENPSHLEAVNPVAEGIARALQDRGSDGGSRVLPLLVHGDAAFPGQGVVAETLNLSQLPGYSTGGTVHVVLNNQIGYTTLPEHARSTRYATDVAKLLMVPIFHVHGEDPEAVLHVARLAVAYRQRFAKDVVIDLVCYRRHGHNEGDEPYFTQPTLYQRIRERDPVHRRYAARLLEEGIVAEQRVEALRTAYDERLEKAHEAARQEACRWLLPEPWPGWEGLSRGYSDAPVATGVERDTLTSLLEKTHAVPEGFHLHDKLRRILDRRLEAARGEKGLDWSGAETLAFASLLVEGHGVRLSGEDSRRGTFSQRHCTWFDTEDGSTYVPLAELDPEQAPFQAYDSPLSEAGVVGFEYGYASVDPRTLVLWEAQYGDFANGAQTIFDQFLASAEAKWQRQNGLVLLLPHGYEGQGPDHSTARPERFLQLCAEDNMEVCVPSTPAQYFHLLRRQVQRDFRKPLVVLTPKSLLRHPDVTSTLDELSSGGFQTVLADPEAPASASRVLLCCGKVYYDLLAARRQREGLPVTVHRVEQLYPFPGAAVAELAARHPDAAWAWVQEEPRNMGAWTALAPQLEAASGRPVKYIGRPAAASPATGFGFIHRAEQQALVDEALDL